MVSLVNFAKRSLTRVDSDFDRIERLQTNDDYLMSRTSHAPGTLAHGRRTTPKTQNKEVQTCNAHEICSTATPPRVPQGINPRPCLSTSRPVVFVTNVLPALFPRRLGSAPCTLVQLVRHLTKSY